MERLREQCWHILSSIGDELDSDRLYANTDWREYMHELHEWLSDVLTEGDEE